MLSVSHENPSIAWVGMGPKHEVACGCAAGKPHNLHKHSHHSHSGPPMPSRKPWTKYKKAASNHRSESKAVVNAIDKEPRRLFSIWHGYPDVIDTVRSEQAGFGFTCLSHRRSRCLINRVIAPVYGPNELIRASSPTM